MLPDATLRGMRRIRSHGGIAPTVAGWSLSSEASSPSSATPCQGRHAGRAKDGAVHDGSGPRDGATSRDGSAGRDAGFDAWVGFDAGFDVGSPPPGQCVPLTCIELGAHCGPQGDGCGSLIYCGDCQTPETCGGGGVPSVCGAGGSVDGGVCQPKTCADWGATCGPVSDGCGGLVQCGSCTAPQACGGGGTPSACGGNTGCVPETCASPERQLRPNRRRLRWHRTVRDLLRPSDVRRRRHAERVRHAHDPRRRRPVHSADLPAARPRLRSGGRRLRRAARVWNLHRARGLRRRRHSRASAAAHPAASRRLRAARLQLRAGGRRLRKRARVRLLHGAADLRWRRHSGRVRRLPGLRAGDVHAARLQLRSRRRRLRRAAAVRKLQPPNLRRWWTAGRLRAPGDAGSTSCTGLCGQQVNCSGIGVTTTVSGTVYAPNGTDPLYNALVYVPNGGAAPTYGVTAFTSGVHCGQCGSEVSGSPLVQHHDRADGTFTLQNVPVGTNIPLVIQVGRWRRKISIPTVTACANTALGPRTPGCRRSSQGRRSPPGVVPRGRQRHGGQHPAHGVRHGFGRRPGVRAAQDRHRPEPVQQPGSAGGTGRVRLYGGRRGPAPGRSSRRRRRRRTSSGRHPGRINQYDMVFFPCQGNESQKTAAQQQVVVNYTTAGGRIFATHYSYVWFIAPNPNTWVNPFLATANWAPNGGSPADQVGYINTSFTRGHALAQWLQTIGASTTYAQMPLNTLRYDFKGVVNPSLLWVSLGGPADRGLHLPDAHDLRHPRRATARKSMRPRALRRLPRGEQRRRHRRHLPERVYGWCDDPPGEDAGVHDLRPRVVSHPDDASASAHLHLAHLRAAGVQLRSGRRRLRKRNPVRHVHVPGRPAAAAARPACAAGRGAPPSAAPARTSSAVPRATAAGTCSSAATARATTSAAPAESGPVRRGGRFLHPADLRAAGVRLRSGRRRLRR